MTDKRPDRKPVQLSLFEQHTVPVVWVMKRWNTGRDTIIRLLHEGALRGYQLTQKGWWRVITQSVFDHEKNIQKKYGSDSEKGTKKA
jgi:hypothetical protein